MITEHKEIIMTELANAKLCIKNKRDYFKRIERIITRMEILMEEIKELKEEGASISCGPLSP